jgi:Flp pilus assembly protein TadD
LKPDDGSILDTLGVAQTHYGKVDIAVDTLKKAISRRPDSADTRINYALALAKAGDGAGARAELRKVVSSDNTVVLGEEAKAVLQAR